MLWGIIAGAATLLAALKPVLQADAKIKRYSALFSAYRQLGLSMKATVDSIADAEGIPKELEREIERVRHRYRSLSVDDDPRPSRRLLSKLQDEVNQETPAHTLFYPQPILSSSQPLCPAPDNGKRRAAERASNPLPPDPTGTSDA